MFLNKMSIPRDLMTWKMYVLLPTSYAKTGVNKDGNNFIVYRKLVKSVLPNHKLYNPNRENERESYFYSLLLLFVPFCNEDDLIKDGEIA